MSKTGIDVLLVDDNPNDAKLAVLWLRASPLVKSVQVVADGEQALKYLRGRDPFADAPRPQLVVLDLNLPRMSGFEVLAEMKSDPELAGIPAIVLSASGFAEDERRARDLQASLYLQKPSDGDGFTAMVSAVEAFWRTHSQRARHADD